MSKKEKLIAKLLSLPTDMLFSDIKKILEWHDYKLDRVKGSHHMFIREESADIVLPVHNKRVKIDYLKKIIQAVEIGD